MDIKLLSNDDIRNILTGYNKTLHDDPVFVHRNFNDILDQEWSKQRPNVVFVGNVHWNMKYAYRVIEQLNAYQVFDTITLSMGLTSCELHLGFGLTNVRDEIQNSKFAVFNSIGGIVDDTHLTGISSTLYDLSVVFNAWNSVAVSGMAINGLFTFTGWQCQVDKF